MEFTLKAVFDTSPIELYKAWLSSEKHSEMTGGTAKMSDQVGDRFTAWNGYIQGTNLELKPPHSIIQSWRTTDFAPKQEDSVIEIRLAEQFGKTELTLHHSNLTRNDEHYKSGWMESYFEPMTLYFGR